MKNKNKIAAITFVVIVIALLIYNLSIPKDTTPQYSTALVTKGSITSTVTATGSLIATRIQYAGFKVPGRIAEINVKQGDTVKVGQQLAKLEVVDLQNALSKAQYNFNAAVYKRDQTSSAPNTDANAVKQAQQQVNTTWVDVQTAQNNLNNAVLTSMYDGVVASVNINLGDSVAGSGNTSLTTTQSGSVMVIVDPSSYQLQMSISESDIPLVKTDQIADIVFDAINDKNYTGKIASIDLLGTTVSNVVSYNARITLDALSPEIKVGMGANVTIEVEKKDNVLMVPNAAIKIVDGKKTVSLLKNDLPEIVNVETGTASDTFTEIVNGVNEGETVITATIIKATNQFSGMGMGGSSNSGTSFTR